MNKRTGNGKSIVPVGLHPAICVGVYDLGHHLNERFNETTRRILLSWELPYFGNRFISREFRFSTSPKSHLVKMVQSWRGVPMTEDQLKHFRLGKLAGAPCSLFITHATTGSGHTFAQVESVLPWPHGLAVAAPKNRPRAFCIDIEEQKGTLNQSLSQLPGWIADKVRASMEVGGGGM